MSDHGLMTTWLATQIVGEEGMKHVTLEPVRVASAYGVCSTADVIAGLAPLARRAHTVGPHPPKRRGTRPAQPVHISRQMIAGMPNRPGDDC